MIPKYDDLNTTGMDAETIFALLPIIVIITPFLYLYYWITGKSIDNTIEYGDTPKEVLQMRYARGEIGHLEYLERMSRL